MPSIFYRFGLLSRAIELIILVSVSVLVNWSCTLWSLSWPWSHYVLVSLRSLPDIIDYCR